MLLCTEYGIHTLEMSMTKLKYSQVQRVNRRFAEQGKLTPLRESRDGIAKSYIFPDSVPGLSIRTYQSESHSNGLSLKINPKTVLSGKYCPIELFTPTEKSSRKLVRRTMDVLEEIGLEDLNDSEITEDRLSLSQLDLTINLYFDNKTDLQELIRLFCKSRVPAHFKRIKGGGYFCCCNGSVTIKAYSKIQELQDKGHCPEAYKDLNILRFEVSLKRDKFISAFDLRRDDPFCTMLSIAYDSGQELLMSYLSKLFPVTAPHCRYCDTVKAIENCGKKSTVKERMRFLVEKTMKMDGLDAAIAACKARFNLKDEQIKRLLEAFRELNVNPITVPDKTKSDRIQPILLTYHNLKMANAFFPGTEELSLTFTKCIHQIVREQTHPREISMEELYFSEK